jgi:hypothetical protein
LAAEVEILVDLHSMPQPAVPYPSPETGVSGNRSASLAFELGYR